MLNKTVRHVGVVSHKDATGVVRAVYDQAREEVGMLPEPVTMFSSAPHLVTATWAPFRESLLSTGEASRVVKEAVAARVSALNKCPYCVDAHTIMLYGGGAGDFATSLLSGTPDPAGDPELTAISDWVSTVMTRPPRPVPAPFPAEQVPEIVGTLVHFHFLNRVINVLLNGTFLPGTERAQRIARRVAGKVLAKRVRAERTPGGAVGLTGGNSLPTDLAWAAPNPAIADAFAGLAAEAARAVGDSVPHPVAGLVERTLDSWDGKAPGLGRNWLTKPVDSVAPADQPAARLALLTAMAPFQVTDDDVTAFRVRHPEDADLLALLTWAAFTTARRIGAWSLPARARAA